jgi:hypothetical protein
MTLTKTSAIFLMQLPQERLQDSTEAPGMIDLGSAAGQHFHGRDFY